MNLNCGGIIKKNMQLLPLFYYKPPLKTAILGIYEKCFQYYPKKLKKRGSQKTKRLHIPPDTFRYLVLPSTLQIFTLSINLQVKIIKLFHQKSSRGIDHVSFSFINHINYFKTTLSKCQISSTYC